MSASEPFSDIHALAVHVVPDGCPSPWPPDSKCSPYRAKRVLESIPLPNHFRRSLSHFGLAALLTSHHNTIARFLW